MIINSGKLSTDVIKRLDKKMVGEEDIYKDSRIPPQITYYKEKKNFFIVKRFGWLSL